MAEAGRDLSGSNHILFILKVPIAVPSYSPFLLESPAFTFTSFSWQSSIQPQSPSNFASFTMKIYCAIQPRLHVLSFALVLSIFMIVPLVLIIF